MLLRICNKPLSAAAGHGHTPGVWHRVGTLLLLEDTWEWLEMEHSVIEPPCPDVWGCAPWVRSHPAPDVCVGIPWVRSYPAPDVWGCVPWVRSHPAPDVWGCVPWVRSHPAPDVWECAPWVRRSHPLGFLALTYHTRVSEGSELCVILATG